MTLPEQHPVVKSVFYFNWCPFSSLQWDRITLLFTACAGEN